MLEIRTFGSSSAGNGYLLIDGDSQLLLEAGIHPRRTKEIEWEKVAGMIITHEHNDHAKYAKEYLKRGRFNIHSTRGTASKLKGVESYRVNEHNYQEPFQIEQWRILTFRIEHDAAEPSGYLIQTPSGKKVLFVTDTYYIRYKFKGVTHYMVECNYSSEILANNRANESIDYHQYNRILRSHFELNNLIEFLKASDLSQAESIHLLHLSDRNSDENEFIDRVQEATGLPTYVAG